MKNILILCAAMVAGGSVFAQQNAKTKHMTLTIVDYHLSFTIGKAPENYFVTRDDTAGVHKAIDLNTHAKLRDQQAAYENMLMTLVKPYYEAGWKLVSTSTEAIVTTGSPTEIFRYYFIKDE